MNRQHRLTDDKKLYQKIIVIEVLQSAAYGDLLKIRDHLRHQKKFLKYENITLKFELVIILCSYLTHSDPLARNHFQSWVYWYLYPKKKTLEIKILDGLRLALVFY